MPVAITLQELFSPQHYSQFGTSLQVIFTGQQKTNLNHYAKIHEKMIDEWPTQDSILKQYRPEMIFNEAKATFSDSPGPEYSFSVCRSLLSMIRLGLVSTNEESELIDLICKQWKHNKIKCIEFFKETESLPSLEDLANLMSTTNTENELDQLTDAWSCFSIRMSGQQLLETTVLIIRNHPEVKPDIPDIFLEKWISLLGEHTQTILKSLVHNKQLNDQQRKRVWLQVRKNTKNLGTDFILDVLPKILTLDDNFNTFQAIIESKKEIIELFSTDTDKKYSLQRALLFSLPGCKTQSSKNECAIWIKEMKNEGIFREIKKRRDQFSEDDIRCLLLNFPSNSTLKNLLKKMSN